MPLSSAGRVANSSGSAIGPEAPEIGLSGYAAPLQRSSPIGSYVMATAEHREPCESRGSRTVLGARGGEIPPRDSTIAPNAARVLQQRMSVAPRKRQLATKVRRVVKGQLRRFAPQKSSEPFRRLAVVKLVTELHSEA